VVTRLPTSLPTWKSCAIIGTEEDGAEEANVLSGTMSVRLDNKSPRSGWTYTLSVITVQAMVIHHLYMNDQFFGFSGSSGPSQVTMFGSVLGLGRKGSGDAEELFFAGVCCG